LTPTYFLIFCDYLLFEKEWNMYSFHPMMILTISVFPKTVVLQPRPVDLKVGPVKIEKFNEHVDILYSNLHRRKY
jgi:hypothetical protein